MTIDQPPAQEVFEQRRRELADYILEHPEEFDMGFFGLKTFCGTAGCIAGQAALQAEREGLCRIQWSPVSDPKSTNKYFDRVVLSGMEENANGGHVDDFARDYLGLRDRNLFYNYGLTTETAAKALLEAPYLNPTR